MTSQKTTATESTNPSFPTPPSLVEGKKGKSAEENTKDFLHRIYCAQDMLRQFFDFVLLPDPQSDSSVATTASPPSLSQPSVPLRTEVTLALSDNSGTTGISELSANVVSRLPTKAPSTSPTTVVLCPKTESSSSESPALVSGGPSGPIASESPALASRDQLQAGATDSPNVEVPPTSGHEEAGKGGELSGAAAEETAALKRKVLAKMRRLPFALRAQYASLLHGINSEMPNASGLVMYLYYLAIKGKSIQRLKQLRSVIKCFCMRASAPPTRRDFVDYAKFIVQRSPYSSASQQYGIVKKFLIAQFGWTEADCCEAGRVRYQCAHAPRQTQGPQKPLVAGDIQRIQELASEAQGYPAFFPCLIGLLHQTRMKFWHVLQLRWRALKYVQSGNYYTITGEGSDRVSHVIHDELAEALHRLQSGRSPDSLMFYCSATQLARHFARLSQSYGKIISPSEILRTANS